VPRFDQPLGRSAIVKALGRVEQLVLGEIQNLSNGHTQVRLSQPIAYASPVMIDFDDERLPGEVVYCEKKQADWLVGIRIEQLLFGLANLSSILNLSLED